MKHSLALLLTVLASALFPLRLEALIGGKTGCSVAIKEVRPFIADYPLFRRLETDESFQHDFHRYFRWLASFGDADPVYVQDFIDRQVGTMEARAAIFHEEVEFLGWLELGHKLSDMMDLRYYQAHYPEVYPIAHSRAVREELSLIGLYAFRRGFSEIPQLAYALTLPVFEKRPGVTVEKLMKRLRYPGLETLRTQADSLTRDEIEQAICVYTDGGYQYLDPIKLIEAVMEYLGRAPSPNRVLGR